MFVVVVVVVVAEFVQRLISFLVLQFHEPWRPAVCAHFCARHHTLPLRRQRGSARLDDSLLL